MNCEKALNTLEYRKITAMLETFVSGARARELIAEMRPAGTVEEAERLLAETAEADRLLFEQAVNPDFAVDDVTQALARARKMSALNMGELLRVSRVLRVSRIAKNLLSRALDAPVIKEYASGLFVNRALEERIDKSIITDTEMSDSASPALRSIRIKIRKLNGGLRARLNSYVTGEKYRKCLQDNIVTVREDRYVIPVKAEYKGEIQGIVHDRSSSGQTLFIEPLAVVEMNNELKTLVLEERAEIENILKDLTDGVRADIDELLRNYEITAALDVIFARAKLARSQNAVRPAVNGTGYVNIIKGRHPLIDRQRVRPITVYLGRDFDIMLVTGPNAGGKTVTLKLVGLFVLMGLSGLFLPAEEGSEISVFDNLFTDIGDEQSIEQSLSTFSGHMTNIVSFIGETTKDSLLLLDELGAGTDPAEGSALAVAITEAVRRTGAKAVLSSHFNALKEYALSTDRVMTSSMDFNPDTFEPVYRLVIGGTGPSNAIRIARRLGLSEEILRDAEGMLGEESRNFDEVLLSAERARKRAEELTEKAAADREEAERELKNIKTELALLRTRNEALNEQIRKGTKKLIEESVEEASGIIAEMKELLEKADEKALFEARRLRKKLENMSADYAEDDVPDTDGLVFMDGAPAAGDEVFVVSLNKTGKVLSAGRNGVEVALGAVRTTVKAGDCRRLAPKEAKAPPVTVSKAFSNAAVSGEIMLIGLSVDEAVEELEEYLPRASGAGLTEVRIVHGKGTGRLREGVRRYLKTNPLVSEFRDGQYGEGERGVTVAKIK